MTRNAKAGQIEAPLVSMPRMTTHVVVMTGRNVANLAPLLALWKAGDRVLLVPTNESPVEAAEQFQQRLEAHGLVRCVAITATLMSHPKDVVDWLQRADVIEQLRLLIPAPQQPARVANRLQAEGAHQDPAQQPLQLIGNGGTKPLQDMLRHGLGCLQGGQSVVVAYAEARPARLLLLQDGAQVCDRPWGNETRTMVTLDDVLAVSGHVRQGGCTAPLWAAGLDVPILQCPAWDQSLLAGPAADPLRLVKAFRVHVAAALLELIRNDDALAAICAQVWLAPVAGTEQEETSRARWDVLLLLRNGVLVHLDCSSWLPHAADDTHADLASLIDRTALCIPLPPGPLEPGTLADGAHQAYLRHRRLGRRVLPWLWPDTTVDLAASLQLRQGNGPGQTCFADGLQHLLAPYVPT